MSKHPVLILKAESPRVKKRWLRSRTVHAILFYNYKINDDGQAIIIRKIETGVNDNI